MKSGIYKITSPSGKVYIGQSVNITIRLRTYKSSGCIYQVRLKKSFEKYGFENHKIEIIEKCSIEMLNNRERHWQDYYEVLGDNGLNCILTRSNDKPRVVSKETRAKYTEAGLKRQPPSKETRQKLSNSLKGRIFTDEWKKNLSNSKKNQSKETREKMSKSRINFTHSKETKLKISQSGMGRKVSDLTVLKLKERASSPLFNSETGIYYDSIKEAHNTLVNISYSSFIHNVNGTNKINRTSFLWLGGRNGVV